MSRNKKTNKKQTLSSEEVRYHIASKKINFYGLPFKNNDYININNNFRRIS